MAQSQEMVAERPAVSNLAGISVVVIVLALTSVIWFQQSQLSDAVKTLAVVSAKCIKK
ncbi:MAG: hypothetical protein ACE5GT_08915 [Rhodospirillales bacterium]